MTPFVIDFLLEGHGDSLPVDENFIIFITRDNTMQQNDESFCCRLPQLPSIPFYILFTAYEWMSAESVA